MIISWNKIRFFIFNITFLLLSTVSSKAEIVAHLTTDLSEDNEACPGCVLVDDQSELVKNAALLSDAAYNDVKSFEKRVQIIEELGCDLANFSSFSSAVHKSFPAGIVCYRTSGQIPQIIVAYHGTESKEDVVTDVTAKKKDGSVIGLKGKVHSGFLHRFLESEDALFTLIREIAEVHGHQLEEIQQIYTGHSMGAALATLGAAVAKLQSPTHNEIYLVTFASPRVVDFNGAEQIEELLSDRILRIWRKGDLISTVSPGTSFPFLSKFTGFKHVGKDYYLNAYGLSPLQNHSMTHFQNEATSEELIHAGEFHRGMWDRLKSWLKR